MGRNHNQKPDRILAPIRSGEIYSLQLLRALTGWGDSAIRAARRAGLRPIYLHGRVLFLGDDVVAYVERAAQEQQSGEQPPPKGDR